MEERCTPCRKILERHWDGEPVDARDWALVSNHVTECDACRAQRATMDQILHEAARLTDLRYPRDVVVSPLHISARRPRGLWWGFVLGLSSAAATFAFALTLMRSEPSSEQGSATMTAAFAETVWVRLAVPMEGARSVAVTGDFTGWKEPIELQTAADGLWTGQLRLPAGRYRYVIVVDGERMLPDPGARQLVDDGFGGKSSVLEVGSI